MQEAERLMDLALEIEGLIAEYEGAAGAERFVEHLRKRLDCTLIYLSMRGLTIEDAHARRSEHVEIQ